MVPVRLAHLMLSCLFTPYSVSNDFAQLCNSWNCLLHCAHASWGTLLFAGYFVQYVHRGFTVKALTAAALRLHWGGIMVMLCEDMLWSHYGYDMVMLWLLLWAVSRGERLCYGCCLSQEVINVSAIPMAPCIFFQLLTWALPTLGSANSANSMSSKTIGIMNRISSTNDVVNRIPNR